MSAHSPEAEQALLGALLAAPEHLDGIAHRLRSDMFGDPVHEEIYRVITSRYRNGHLADVVAVASQMADHEGLKQLGGKEYLLKITLAAATFTALPSYADLLRDLASKRHILSAIDAAKAQIDEGEVDADAIAGALEASLISRETAGKQALMSFHAAVNEAADAAVEAHQREGVAGARTGIYDLDQMTGGLFPGDLWIVGGRPSMGKTAMALSVALGQAREGGGVAISSMEMTAASLAARAIAEAAARDGSGVAYSDVRKGLATDGQVKQFVESALDIANLPIQIIPPHIRDIGALYSAAKRAKTILDGRGVGMKALMVDYLQLIRSSKQSRLDQISEISMALKGLAMQLEVPVIALSQLSRGVESRDNKRPVMSDLRESGQIEQDADVIIFCYRDEYYAEREKPGVGAKDGALLEWDERMSACRNRLDLIVAKQRMGEVGTITVGFNPAFNLIWDLGGR